MLNYEPFDGDGRQQATMPVAAHVWPGAPIRVTNGAARRTIDMFAKSGSSYHSSTGGTVWVIMAWCIAQRHAFSVETHYHADKVRGHTVKLVERR